MKLVTYTFLCCLLLSFWSCEAEKEEPPQAVVESLNTLFADASTITWTFSEEEWEANFYLDEFEYEVSFSESGEWLETEQHIPKKQVPEVVLQTLNDSFPNHDIMEMEMITSDHGTNYEFDLEKDGHMMEVELDRFGKILETEMN